MSVGLSVCLSVVLFTLAAAAIVDDNWPGFAINYVDIWLVNNCMSDDQLQQYNGRACQRSNFWSHLLSKGLFYMGKQIHFEPVLFTSLFNTTFMGFPKRYNTASSTPLEQKCET